MFGEVQVSVANQSPADQAERHEFFGGEVFALTGARATHTRLRAMFFALLKHALRGTPCRVFIAEMKLHVAAAMPRSIPTCS